MTPEHDLDPQTLTGAELLRRALVQQGTRVIFGHPGGAILPFYDALHDAPAPRHVLVRHEQAAAHAADGWARVTGRPGVCCATSGPGATNLVTGLATALMDGVPLVAITGQVPLALLGTEAFQETDVLGVTMPVTKHGFLVERADELPAVVAEAFRLAQAGRPGPVVIDIPKCVQAAVITDDHAGRLLADAPGMNPGPVAVAPADPGARAAATPAWAARTDAAAPGRSRIAGRDTTAGAALAAALSALYRSRRPVLLVGRGVVASRTSPLVADLAQTTRMPVATTLLGLDAYPRDAPLALGMPGMHGTERTNRALQEADLVVGLGVRFDDRVTGRTDRFAPHAQIVHFDIDPRAHGRTLEPEVAVLGDLRETLPPFVRGATEAYRTPASWLDTIRTWSADPLTTPAPDDTPPTGPLTGRSVARALAARIRDDEAVVVTDVGQHQMWLAQELRATAPATHLTSGGLGTMGYALPAALGATLAETGRPVWAVIGDGGFQMTLQELATVVQEGAALRIAIMNNGALGMVRQWQTRVYDARHSGSTLGGPDFAALATLYGLAAETVTELATLDEAIQRAATTSGPALLDLRISADDAVYPMVRPGGAIDELWYTSAPPTPASGPASARDGVPDGVSASPTGP